MMNILNGGAHADTQRGLSGVHGDAARHADVRRRAACGRRDFSRAARAAQEARALDRRGRRRRIRARASSNREAVELVLEAVGKAGLHAGTDMFIALDVASSEFWDETASYVFKKSGEDANVRRHDRDLRRTG